MTHILRRYKMYLLKEGIEQNAVIKTDLTRKLTVDGITQSFPVYKVRLDWLFYNDQNDRIATWMSQYRSQNNGMAPDINNREEYNRVIQQFIYESNPDAIKKTKTNIALVDQREPGVVLNDGRIIDGNRRFTCLRMLAEDNDKFNYFETVILDRSIENSAKQIKMLELSIQHGEESRVDYNPVDRLVGLYNDVVKTKLLTVEEYSRSVNESVPDVKRRIETANLMVEFLEFINAPEQFYIARDMQIVFPLEELHRILKKCKTEDEAEDLKIAVFNNILLQTTTDMGRFIRNFKSIIGTEYQEEFLEEQKELAAQTIDILPERGKVTTAVIRDEIRTNTNITEAVERSVEKALTKVKKTETKNRPVQLVEKATTLLESIDTNIFFKMNDSDLRRLERQLGRLEDVIKEIRENI